MNYDEYQSLEEEQKMLVRFQSLDAVLQAASLEHHNDDVEEGCSGKEPKILQGVIRASKDGDTLTVRVEPRFSSLPKKTKTSANFWVRGATLGPKSGIGPALKPGDRVFIQRDMSRLDEDQEAIFGQG